MVVDRQTGFLYDFYDVAELASLMENVLSQDCVKISLAASAAASARHDREANACRLVAIYKSIMQR